MATPYISGSCKVITAGRPIQIASIPTPLAWVIICAMGGNTGLVYIGDHLISATATPPRGAFMYAGAQWQDQNVDLSAIYIDAEVALEGVTFTGGFA